MSDERRWRCQFCREIFPDAELLTAPHPFAVGTIPGCSRCKAAFGSEVDLMCDESGCAEEVVCGWPSPKGHRCTCHKHYKVEEVKP